MKLKRVDESHIEKFRNQAKISKMFGKTALKAYNAIPNDKWIDEEELLTASGMDKETLDKVIEFMDKEGMLEIATEGAEMKQETAQPAQELQPPQPPQPPQPEQQETAQPIEAVGAEVEEEIEGSAEIAPEFEEETAQPTQEPSQPPQQPQPPQPEQQEIAQPTTSQQAEQEVVFEGQEGTESSEIVPEFEETAQPAVEEEHEEEQVAEEIPPTYTEEEASIYKKFGDVGVKVYHAVKEGKSIRDIVVEEGLGEDEVKRISDYLEQEGLFAVEVEKPEEEQEEERFAPLSSEITETSKLTEVPDSEAIKVAKLKKLSFFDKLKAKFSTILKFKKYGRMVFDTLDDGQEHDTIELVKKLSLDINKINDIIEHLNKLKVVELKNMKREDVRKKYGYDSLTVYRKYGRAGVLMYDLVGKDMTLKQIANLAGVKDKEKVYEMFSFIHRLLGIDIPIDKSLIMKQLS